jgi:predicted ester cyclase
MSTGENKALVRRMYELLNRKELNKYFVLLAPGYIEHFAGRDMSLKQAKELDTTFSAAFPDDTSTIEDMVAEGDKVAVRVTHRMTHKGEYMGLPATGKKIEGTVFAIFRIIGGKFTECWATTDNLNFMQQLGAIPPR